MPHERVRYKAVKRVKPQHPAARMSRDEIVYVVIALSDLLAVLREADPDDKAEIYIQLGQRLIYQPADQTVRTGVHISPAQHRQFESVRGASRTNCLRRCAVRGFSRWEGGMTSRADEWIRRTTIGCVAELTAIAGTVSYLHMHLLVEEYGQPGRIAALTRCQWTG